MVRVVVEFGLGTLLAAAGIGWDLGAGYAIDAVVNGIWVVAVVNSFNLFDNMDGAASTMAVVVTAAACVLGLVAGNAWVAVGSAALCGACLGFLPHNLASPARIFLGDGGSMRWDLPSQRWSRALRGVPNPRFWRSSRASCSWESPRSTRVS